VQSLDTILLAATLLLPALLICPMASETDLAHFVNEYTFTRLSEFVFKIVQVRQARQFFFFLSQLDCNAG